MRPMFFVFCLSVCTACLLPEYEFEQAKLSAVVSDIRIVSEGPGSAELVACGFTAKTENETIVFRIDKHSGYQSSLARCSLLREGDRIEFSKNERLHKGKLVDTSYVWVASDSAFGSVTGKLVLQ